MEELEPRQKDFCEQYMVDMNGTQAAIRAGYSASSARQIATENLSKPSIQEYIAQLQKARSERTQITADRVLKEVANIAFSNIRSFAEFNNDGIRFKDSAELTDEQMALVSELQQTEGKYGTNVKFKLYCKDTALYNLMRHLGLYEKDNEQSRMNILIDLSDDSQPAKGSDG